jgi:hypothetical protein
MEWITLAAPVPAAVDFNLSGVGAFVLELVAAGVPVLLIVRDALRGARTAGAAPRLRVFDGGKEPRRHAA